MIYTYEQMKERFGTHYTTTTQISQNIGVKVVRECFGFQDYWQKYPTVEAALEGLKEEAISRLEKEEERIDAILARYQALPWWRRALAFVFKRGWKATSIVEKRLKEFNDQLDQDLTAIDNYKLELINPNITYNFKYPNLKVGDKVYVAVTDKNALDAGLHEMNIETISYHMQGGEVFFAADTDKDFRLRQLENEISDGYMYHHVFLKREEAVTFLKQNIQSKIQKLVQLENSLEETNANS